jgi:hypothetical protein
MKTLINPTSSEDRESPRGTSRCYLAKEGFLDMNHVCRPGFEVFLSSGSQIPATLLALLASLFLCFGDLNFRRMTDLKSHQPRASTSPAAPLTVSKWMHGSRNIRVHDKFSQLSTCLTCKRSMLSINDMNALGMLALYSHSPVASNYRCSGYLGLFRRVKLRCGALFDLGKFRCSRLF